VAFSLIPELTDRIELIKGFAGTASVRMLDTIKVLGAQYNPTIEGDIEVHTNKGKVGV
jgi:hypothetical protein